MKRYRLNQSRRGDARRRKLEYDVVRDQLQRRKDAFIRRLESHCVPAGDCLIYQGTLDRKGYARLNFKYKGAHVTIHAHRLFLILQLGHAIPLSYEAGHAKTCSSRACVRHVRLEHYKLNARTNIGACDDGNSA